MERPQQMFAGTTPQVTLLTTEPMAQAEPGSPEGTQASQCHLKRYVGKRRRDTQADHGNRAPCQGGGHAFTQSSLPVTKTPSPGWG